MLLAAKEICGTEIVITLRFLNIMRRVAPYFP
jgi:hypothetical protein